jgi:hypothetical protein
MLKHYATLNTSIYWNTYDEKVGNKLMTNSLDNKDPRLNT